MVGMCGNNSLTKFNIILTAMTTLESENCSGGQDTGEQVKGQVAKIGDVQ